VALAGLCLMAGSAVQSQPLTPDEQLQAIRQSLVQLALDGPTEVRNTAWLDDQGRLQDSSSFRTGMTVRGVRVIAYGRDLDQQATAQVSASGQAAPTANGSCAKGLVAGQPWHQMQLELAVSPQMPLVNRQQAHQAARYARTVMLEQGRRSAVWRLQEAALPVSLYERALSLQGEQHVPWRLQLVIAPASASREMPPMLFLRWRAVHRHDPSLAFDHDALVTLEERAVSMHPDRLSTQVMADLHTAVEAFLANVEQRLSCLPPQFQVLNREGTSRYRIAAGHTSGLKVGDRLVMVDPQKIPGRALEPKSLERMALAQVDSLGPYYAELKQVAGPSLPAGTPWVAVPVIP
jgi:hypothetical protein